jgi:pSer/pThr/pTyr-binding forkhead associated (FHA) protein
VKKSCPSCKIDLDPQYLFCPECGSTLTIVPDGDPKVDLVSIEAPPSTLDAALRPASASAQRPRPASSQRPRPGTSRFRIVRLARGGGSATPFDVPEGGIELGQNEGGLAFPDDDTISPRHALVRPSGDTLEVEDLGSLNGLYVRLSEPYPLIEADTFVCGDSVFRVSLIPGSFGAAEYKLFSAPTEKPVLATLTRILGDGRDGEVYPVRQLPFLIGREEGDIRLGADRFLSRRHAALQAGAAGMCLADQKSRNGTYIRRRGSLRLQSGDIFLIGRQLLRVEAVTL